MKTFEQTFGQRLEMRLRTFKVYGCLRSDKHESFLGTISVICASYGGHRHAVKTYKAIAKKIRVEEV